MEPDEHERTSICNHWAVGQMPSAPEILLRGARSPAHRNEPSASCLGDSEHGPAVLDLAVG